MFRLLFVLALIAVGLFAGAHYAGQQGYVLISVAHYTIEMSVTTLVLIIMTLLIGLFLIEALIKKTLHLSLTGRHWFSMRKQRHARRDTQQAIVHLFEEQWKPAQKKALRWAKYNEAPLVNYLIAAQAAHKVGNNEQSQQFLTLAGQQKEAQLAVGLTQLKQQMDNKQWQQALEIAQNLKDAHNTSVLPYLKTLYCELQQWRPLLELLPELLKAQHLTQEEFHYWQSYAHQQILHHIAQEQGLTALTQYWDSLSRKEKSNPELVLALIPLLIELQADYVAFNLIKESLHQHPRPEFYALLTQLNLSDQHLLVNYLQSALARDGHNAEANSALGRIYLKMEEWAKAQTHLETALSLRVNLADYGYLSDALAQQNRLKAAQDVARKGLSLVP